MRFVFIVQGEGRGHLTQAMAMHKMLQENGHTVSRILVGTSPSRRLPDFFTDAVGSGVEAFESFNFVPGGDGRRPSIAKTIAYNVANVGKFLPSIKKISRILREENPDVVVNFYDILGTFGYAFSRIRGRMAVIGHQFLYLHPQFRFPRKGYGGRHALNLFTRMISWRASKVLALSFRDMPAKGRLTVVPPLLREEVLAMEPSQGDYIHGYMLNSGFADEVTRWHGEHPDVPLRFFWDKRGAPAVTEVDGTLSFYYLDGKEFLRQMAGCMAYASTAGFESVCEAMYFGKPMLLVPSHIEQQCNAFDAESGGAAVQSSSFDLGVLLDFAKGRFRRDEAFPAWARSGREVILRELENIV